MGMSGMRQLAVGLGAIERTPPDAILKEGVPTLLRSVPEHRRSAAIELMHWGYGATAGAIYGTVPAKVRRWRISGPVYGLLSWGFFEFAIAPALGLAHAHRSRPYERAALLVDHVFFGFVVGEPPETVVVGPEGGQAQDGEASRSS
ncbi:hypothetical protein [Nocardiopsis oceani]